MQKKQIRLGNTVFSITSAIPVELGGNLPLFVTTDEPDIEICVRYALHEEETPHAHGYALIDQHGNCFSVAIRPGCFPRLSVWQILSMLPVSKLLMERGTLVCHAACVIHQGAGIAFSGPSGIGKSTQADLWSIHRNATVINGDRVLITVTDDGVLVASHYLCGTSGICINKAAPLRALVLLGQAKRNRGAAATPLDGFRQVLSQLDYDFRDRSQMVMMTSLVEKLMATVPIIRYDCCMDESAVTDLEKYLYEKHPTQNDP